MDLMAKLSIAFDIAVTGAILSGLLTLLIARGKKPDVSSKFWALWPFGDKWRQYVSESDQKLYSKIRWTTWMFEIFLLLTFAIRLVEQNKRSEIIKSNWAKIMQEDKTQMNGLMKQYNALTPDEKTKPSTGVSHEESRD